MSMTNDGPADTRSDGVRIERIAVRAMTEADLAELWALAKRFQVTDEGYFRASIVRHDEVFRFRELGKNELVGLAAIDIRLQTMPDGKKAVVIFTSNVVIDRRFRGRNLLQRAGLRAYLSSCLKYPGRTVYWFFTTFSYKSYLLLARNFSIYWPRPDQDTPADVRGLLDLVVRDRYGETWDPSRGIVRRSARKRLRDSVAPVGEDELTDPLIRHFVKLNPGHRQGDMLVCLAPLTLANWRSVVGRAVTRGIRSIRPPSTSERRARKAA